MTTKNEADAPPGPSPTDPRGWWQRWRWLLVVAVVAVVAVVPALLLILRPTPLVPDAPLMEDGYYSYTVARNIALGKGITITDGMWTNGFQPLFTFGSVLLFLVAGSDRYLAVRLMLVLHWLLYLATAYFLGRIASDSLPLGDQHRSHENQPWWKIPAFWLTAFLYLSSVFPFLQHFNGLETGCLLLLYSATWRYYQVAHLNLDTLRGVAVLGVLLGLLVLARIDAVFFVILLCAYQLVAPEASRMHHRVRRFARLAGISFLITLPWWLYNLVGFGHLIPSSGLSQQEWVLSLPRLASGLEALIQGLFPPLPFTYVWRISRALGLGCQVGSFLVGLVLLWLGRNVVVRPLLARVRSHARGQRTAAYGAVLFLSVLVLCCWYIVSTPAAYFYPRYFAPVLPVSTVVMGLLLSWLIMTYQSTSHRCSQRSWCCCYPCLCSRWPGCGRPGWCFPATPTIESRFP
ncbi:MAG: hypothetical protein HC884_11695 [Chloroflexaceae bacterium]|nr:hypothetical protein [Chloroflexaceae bacterium]